MEICATPSGVEILLLGGEIIRPGERFTVRADGKAWRWSPDTGEEPAGYVLAMRADSVLGLRYHVRLGVPKLPVTEWTLIPDRAAWRAHRRATGQDPWTEPEDFPVLIAGDNVVRVHDVTALTLAAQGGLLASAIRMGLRVRCDACGFVVGRNDVATLARLERGNLACVWCACTEGRLELDKTSKVRR